MDIAVCAEDGKIYGSGEFSRLATELMERKRRLLRCPECGGPAFFRNASFSGRAACFGARPHEAGCRLATQDEVRVDGGAGEDPDALYHSGRKIVVDFNYGAADPPGHLYEAARADREFRGGYPPDSLAHCRMSSLLRTLIGSTAFRHSYQRIEAHHQPEMAVRDFFVPLLAVTAAYKGLTRGFWGLISDVRWSEDRSTIWFNSGGLDTISFCMDARWLGEFNRRYRIHDEEDLAGVYILVIGTLEVSPNDKVFCVIENLDFMALRLA